MRAELIHSGNHITYNGWSRIWSTASCGSGSMVTSDPFHRVNHVQLIRQNVNGSTVLGDVNLSNQLPQTAWGVGSGTSNVCGSYSFYVIATVSHIADNGFPSGNWRTSNTHAQIC